LGRGHAGRRTIADRKIMTDIPLLTLAEAVERVTADHELLVARIDGLTAVQLAAPYQTVAGPLGDFCASLHDLVAHVLMWDEINLAVMSETEAGREHWSLAPQWETPDAGRMLNRAGVAAGRLLPAELLRHRSELVHAAILDQFRRSDEVTWSRPRGTGRSVGALAEHVWTVPGQPPFWHAAIHLNQLVAQP
jgi:hypothetical protein